MHRLAAPFLLAFLPLGMLALLPHTSLIQTKLICTPLSRKLVESVPSVLPHACEHRKANKTGDICIYRKYT